MTVTSVKVSSEELADRARIRAFRGGSQVLIVAEGELPTPGFEVDIKQDPRKIFPPQFDLLRRSLPGFFPQVVTPYRYAESVPYPQGQRTITVHHAGGADKVEIEDAGPELAAYREAVAGGAEEATGFSKNLMFDEAFANAVAALPPSKVIIADGIERIVVQEIGALFGGFFPRHDLYVRVRRTEVI